MTLVKSRFFRIQNKFNIRKEKFTLKQLMIIGFEIQIRHQYI